MTLNFAISSPKNIVEEFFLNDPELHDEVPPAYLSHKEVYEYAVRRSVIISRKLRELQADGKVGLDDFQ